MQNGITKEQVEESVRTIFQYIGEDPNRPGLQGTPDRIVRMYDEIFRGYDKTRIPKVTTFINGEDGLKCDQMVTDRGDFYSNCEHHMLPFFGKYWFAYIPNPDGKILGISKVARVVDYFAAKMQIQERLVTDVLDHIEAALTTEDGIAPLGLALVMEAEHLCKSMRGVKKKGTMTSTDLRGIFKTDTQVRSEFLSYVHS